MSENLSTEEYLRQQLELAHKDLEHLRAFDYYSAALDEIYFLRRALAYERMYQRAYLDFLTLPKGVRNRVDVAMARIKLALRYGLREAYKDVSEQSWNWSIRSAGMPQTLTRYQWEDEVNSRKMANGN